MTTPDVTAWYWGSLRAAVAADQWERAWTLIAAWPCHPPEAGTEAHRYLLRAAAEEEDPEPATAAAGLLEYYRALPVPPAIPKGQNPSSFVWRSPRCGTSLTGRRFNRNSTMTSLYWDKETGLGIEGAWTKEPDGGMLLTVRGVVAPGEAGPREASSCSPEGPHEGQGRPHSGNESLDWEILRLKGGRAMEGGALLLRRFSREMDALMPGSSLELAWPPDILKRLWDEGPDAHPALRFYEGERTPHPASVLREELSDLAPGLVLPVRFFRWRANEETNALMSELNAALRRRDLSLNWRAALTMLDMTPAEVLRETGTAADSPEGRCQVARWGAIQAERDLTTRLSDAMERSCGPAVPPTEEEFSLEQVWEMTLGEWDPEDPAQALYQAVLEAPWVDENIRPQNRTEVLGYALEWERIADYRGDDTETLNTLATLAPQGELLTRFLNAAYDSRARRLSP